MSIMYCEKHDTKWDSDFLSECPVCENEHEEVDVDAALIEALIRMREYFIRDGIVRKDEAILLLNAISAIEELQKLRVRFSGIIQENARFSMKIKTMESEKDD